MPETPLAVVAQWQDAANTQDVAQLLDLSSPDIEVVGPPGSGRGHEALKDWVPRAGLPAEPLRTFARANAVVVEQRASWGTDTSDAQIVASAFEVEDGRVVRVARYEALVEALEASGLSDSDEVHVEP